MVAVMEVREVYRSASYDPLAVQSTYARENRGFEEGGFRVVEVDAGKRTVREYVTQDVSMFSAEQLSTMRERANAGIYPSWTLL